MKSHTLLIAAVLLAGCSGESGSPATQIAADHQPDATPPDLSGYWVRTDEAGSGDFGGMFARLPQAQLTPAYQAQADAAAAVRKAAEAELEKKDGNVYRVKADCHEESLTFMMQHSGAVNIVQGKDVVLIIPESPGTQHVYMDGRAHPKLSEWTSGRRGHSVGRYEDGALIINTVGLETGGDVPAGGRKRPETELIEKFTLRDPTHMTVHYTWNDPEIYVKPHSYEFTYEKQPADAYAFESWCDVTDPLQGQSIVVPPQH